MPNPLVPQGTLNRLKASILLNSFPALNITPPFLGREAIRLAFEGAATTFINTMTGAVTSPEPYQKATITANLLKTQGLADAWKQQYESSSLLGDLTVRPDVTSGGIGPYPITNCAIQDLRELNFAGEDAGWIITIGGYYLINSTLFN